MIAFVTPVHGRYEITRICLEQRLRVCDELADHGIAATCVCVGEDRNLDIAREFGFHTVQQINDELGRKFNDGIEYACRELAADHAVAIGSDDWIMTEYLLNPPRGGEVRSGGHLTVVRPDGLELASLTHEFRQSINARGFIPWVVPRETLAAMGYRPILDRRNRGIDACMGTGICRTNPRPIFSPSVVHPLQCVDFKNPLMQITPYDRTIKLNRSVVLHADPWEYLATSYDPDLCDKLAKVYAEQSSR